MPSRRLEDRIRELCHRLLSAADWEALALIRELREALHEHAGCLDSLAQLKLLSPGAMIDRRSHRSAANLGDMSGAIWRTSRSRHAHRARVEAFRGCSMNPIEQQRWIELCRQIAAEQDPKRLLELAEQMSHLQPQDNGPKPDRESL